MTRKSSKGCFPKGHVPWNKGRHFKAGGRSAETQFKNGTIPPNYQPVGAITTHSDGYRYIKLAERKWQLYQRCSARYHCDGTSFLYFNDKRLA